MVNESIDARNSDSVGSVGSARCFLRKHLENQFGEMVDRGEMVYKYSPMRNKWVGWVKKQKNGSDWLVEKVGEFESIP